MAHIAPHKQLLTVPITRTTHDALRDLAREKETTMSAIVRELILNTLKAARRE